jgi:hypothetical protein
VKPLTSLLEKGKEFKWDEACQKCFDELKEKLTTTPVLIMPDIHKGFYVYCDASHLGLGCVLMQEGKVIAYDSRQLRKCWGLVLKCYELRTRQHKMLMVKDLRPSKHYLPLGYNDLQTKVMKDIPS